jgi:hypothetical protein
MSEWMMIASIAFGTILFPAGGTHIPGIGGQKWLRRYLMPVLLGGIALLSGFPAWTVACYTIGLIVALTLGYGETKPYWYKFLVFCGYSAPSLFLGLTIWQAITPVVLLLLFWLSNRPGIAKDVPWKVWEASAGFLIGVTLAVLMSLVFILSD